eukprot:TRINITY_DN74923_c0_g1_i1.p1 TRINITY_DN74923_c0_g1~~TRINITY_DN74923_c0_g1_i1.p1  ORF type:complete len:663 (-),score=123.33 TRINITY_DN74923_c0_g1_i1:30-1856(-)
MPLELSLSARCIVKAVLAMAVCLTCGATAESTRQHTVSLTTRTFDQYLKKHPRVFVNFFQSSCPHCSKLEPEFKEAAKLAAEDGLMVQLATVNAPENDELMQLYKIENVPGLLYFKDGERSGNSYEGGATAGDLVSFVRKQEVGAVAELAADDVQKFVSKAKTGEFVMIARLGRRQSENTQAFWQAAELLQELPFRVRCAAVWLASPSSPSYSGPVPEALARTFLNALEVEYLQLQDYAVERWLESNPGFETELLSVEDEMRETELAERLEHLASLYDEWGIDQNIDPDVADSVTVHRVGFEAPDASEVARGVDAEEAWNAESLVHWLKWHSYPLVGKRYSGERYGRAAMDDLRGLEGAVVLVLDDEREDELRPKLLPQLEHLALLESNYRVTTDEVSRLRPFEIAALGGLHGVAPWLSLTIGEYKFVLKNETELLAPDGIKNFFKDAKDGLVRPAFKSASPPLEEVNDHGLVEVTGESFERVVLNESANVFVSFYDERCGYCKQLAPTWEKLAEAVQKAGWTHEGGVVVARMEGYDNECEETPLLKKHGFPRLVLYPAGGLTRKLRTRAVYDGPRDLGLMLEFLISNIKGLTVPGESRRKSKSFQEL